MLSAVGTRYIGVGYQMVCFGACGKFNLHKICTSVLVSIESIFTAFSLISTLIRVMIMPLLADTAGV